MPAFLFFCAARILPGCALPLFVKDGVAPLATANGRRIQYGKADRVHGKSREGGTAKSVLVMDNLKVHLCKPVKQW